MKILDWDAVGAIGETIGAIAVLVTLNYLSVQIRQNTASNQNIAIQTISAHNAEWLSLVTANAEVARIYEMGSRDLGSLEGEDLVRFTTLMAHFFRLDETQYHLHPNEAIPAELWEGSVSTLKYGLQFKGRKELWKIGKRLFSPAFVEFVDSEIVRSDP